MLIISLTQYVEAALNKGLELDGDPDSAFEAPDHPSLDGDIGPQLTVEAWVNPKENAGEHMIVNKEDVYEIALVDGIFKTAIRPAGQGWDWISSDTTVPEGKWSHVAITYDEEETRTYVNGKFETKSAQWQGKLNDSPDTLKVGKRTRGDATHSAFIGLIDEVRISSAIRYDKDFVLPNGAFIPDNDTLALYHFDEEVGGKVLDFSKKQNHGKLVRKAKLVSIVLPNTLLAVQPSTMLSIAWGRIKVAD